MVIPSIRTVGVMPSRSRLKTNTTRQVKPEIAGIVQSSHVRRFMRDTAREEEALLIPPGRRPAEWVNYYASLDPVSIDLRLLESFVILAEELHFTRAAERLHIAQPALSQQIGRLERQIGAKLLTRPPLPVSLTPAGNEFRARAGAALAGIRAAVAAARAVADGTAGDLTIGHLSSYAPHVIPAIAGAFRAMKCEVRTA